MNHTERTEINAIHHKIATLEEHDKDIMELFLKYQKVIEALVDKVTSLENLAHFHAGVENGNSKKTQD
jgi:hypothetical protein